tara:strand:- start:5916 stop:6353 length:438 start_codon:yes stop_codon:yes gene_type:complete
MKKKKISKTKRAKANNKEVVNNNTLIKREGEINSSGIPKFVADRMARRIAFTTGIPTICGMLVFIISYYIVSKNIAEISPSSTISLSALFFLVGLAGLSYGILSASWDKEPGSILGIENIPKNIQRMKNAFKPASQNEGDNNIKT